ncbi:MAG: amino acid adenylation domain-containing protein [bacterium]|nr:amino acid adenylation domain-containing protein [bacterium]
MAHGNIAGEKTIASGQYTEEEKYWLAKLSGQLPRSLFPTDYSEGKTGDRKMETLTVRLPDKTAERLLWMANNSSYRLHMMLTASVAGLLQKYVRNETHDTIIGAPVYKQDTEGEFINTILLLRCPTSLDTTFKTLLGQIKKTVTEAVKHQNYPVEILLERLDFPGSEPRLPDVFVLLKNIHAKEYITSVLARGTIATDAPNILFMFNTKAEEIHLELEYNGDLYKKSTMESLVSRLENLMGTGLFKPDTTLSAIEVLSRQERQQLLEACNYTTVGYPKDQTIHGLFEARATGTPNAIAVKMGTPNTPETPTDGETPASKAEGRKKTPTEITYGDLDKRANSLAHILRQKGVGPGTVAGVMLEPSIDTITSLLAILKAGGAYLPVDPTHPGNRVQGMLADSNTPVLLTRTDTLKNHSFTALQGLRRIYSQPRVNAACPQISELDGLPLPDRSLVDYEKYNRHIGQAMVKNCMAVQGTRGCPYNCTYCHKIWPKKQAVRSAENLFAEVKLYYDMGIRRFAIIDDIFNLDIKNSSRFFQMVIKAGMNRPKHGLSEIQFFFPNGLRGDILTPDYIDMMVEAGTMNAALALETASPRLQKLIRKNLNLDKFRKTVEYFIEKHPKVILEMFTMHGFPTETEEEALMTLNFINSMKWIHFPYVHILKIYPNTDMATLAIESGISAETIHKSTTLAYHQLPETLPFDKRFTLNYQASFLNEYFLSKERLKHVLPFQVQALTEREVVDKYDSYLPTEIGSFNDLLQFTGLKGELPEQPPFKKEESVTPTDLNNKITKAFEKGGTGYEINEAAYKERKDKREAPAVAKPLRLLLLDLSQYFSGDSDMLYDVVEPPLGLMYILTHLKSTHGDGIEGKIAKSRIDFDNYGQLKELLEEFKPDVIGMRTLTFYKDFFHQTAAVMREWGIAVPIIAGGPYAGSDYINLLQDRNIDVAVPGEGELIAADLIEKIMENGNRLPDADILGTIPGLAFTDRGSRGKKHAAEILLLDHLILPTGDQLPGKTLSPVLPEERTKSVASAGDPAYLIFTSGSTGTPKGALIEHRNVVRLLFNDNNLFDFSPRDTWTMFHSYCFDFSVWEMYGSLLYGGKLVVVPRTVARDTAAYLALLRREKVTVLNQTPSAFYTLMELELQQASLTEGSGEPLDDHLRTVIFGGEALAPLKLKEWYTLYPHIKLINMFGITETTVHVTYKEIGDIEIADNISNIGVPIPTLVTYVLNDRLQLLPPGVAGEMCVGGEGVGRGYLNRPLLTSEKFTANPHIPGGMLYRSGDLVRLLDNGDMDYLGRIDHQIQVRGFRIELGEIRDRMLKHKRINDAVIIAHPTAGICAYFVAKTEVEIAEIRDYLLLELPEYMVPSFFIRLETVPLTSNGKVDRKALPEPQLKSACGIAPRDGVEKRLAAVWREVLDMEEDHQVTIRDNFFELGGHSLKATTMVAKIHRAFDVRLPLADLFENPTIEELAGIIKKTVKTEFISVEPVEKRDYYPLSSAQRRLFILQQMNTASTQYNMPQVIPINRDYDKDRLEAVFKQLIARHESLRTSFFMANETPVQVVHSEVDFQVFHFEAPGDIGEIPDTPAVVYDNGAGQGELHEELVRRHFVTPFDLSRAPLLRVGIAEDRDKYKLLIDLHHIISDGLSQEILEREFVALYGGETLPPLRLQYRDYSQWQNSDLRKRRVKTQEDYWLDTFSGELPVLTLPQDFARPVVREPEGSTVGFYISPEETAAIRLMGKTGGGTTFMALLALFNILLARLSGQEDIIVGTPTAGRPHADLEHIMGMFVNTLALRNAPTGNKTCSNFLDEVKTNTLAAFENQDYQFETLVETIVLRRDTGRNPVFDIMFALQDRGAAPAPSEELPGHDAAAGQDTLPEFIRGGATISKFDLTFNCIETPDVFIFSIEYCTKLFKAETIERFAGYFKRTLSFVTDNPNAALSEVDILSHREKHRLLYLCNETRVDVPSHLTLHQLFERRAVKTPDSIALTGWGLPSRHVQVTYGNLNRMASKFASLLVTGGVRPNSIVALEALRSVETIGCILGILKAGGAYLPLDGEYPIERIRFMLEDSSVSHMAVGDRASGSIAFSGNMVYFEDIFTSQFSADADVPAAPMENGPSSLAYIIYTSGSTGLPKGVMIEHSNAVNLAVSQTAAFNVTREDRILQFSSLCFDASVEQVWLALSNSAVLVLVDKNTLLSNDAFPDYLVSRAVTHLNAVPPFLNNISLTGHHLKRVIAGGDLCSVALAEKYNTESCFYNEYGPTETTVTSIRHHVQDTQGLRTLPIGRPVGNTTVYILDGYLNMCPQGTAGELYIGGAGVARGYLNRPGLTAERFLFIRDMKFQIPQNDAGEASLKTGTSPNDVSEANQMTAPETLRLYRTGDLARYLPDGNLEFLGRNDQQVKIRGFRIELGEIENCLLHHQAIEEAVVIDCGKEGQKYLCAYIVAVPDADSMFDSAAKELKKLLAETLPAYMIPDRFVKMETLPLTPSGKIDRKKLPEPEIGGGPTVAPTNQVEETLVHLWADVLELEEENISIDADFFELGGHSLRATTLVAKIHRSFDVRLPLSDIFENPTIEQLGQLIGTKETEAFASIAPAPEQPFYKVSPVQRRLFFLQQLDPDNISYNMPQAVLLEGNYDVNRLESTLVAMLNRHESLRTSFRVEGDLPVQVVHGAGSVQLGAERHHLEMGEEIDHLAVEKLSLEFVRPFDLSIPPLMRIAFIEVDADRLIVMMDTHHIISDGVSQGVFISDFLSLYKNKELAPLRVQYKDFSCWQNSDEQQEQMRQREAYWLRRFNREVPLLQLPVDFPRPPAQTFKGDTVFITVDKEQTIALNAMAREFGATLYIVLLTLYTTLLGRLAGQEDIIVGTSLAGRRHSDLMGIIGMFVNALTLRNYPVGEKTYKEFLLEVRDNTINDFDNQDYQFESLLEKTGIKRVPGRNPVFDVMMVLNNEDLPPLEIPDVKLSLLEFGKTSAQMDLKLRMSETPDGLGCLWEYSTSLFKKETMEMFAANFIEVIRQVIDNNDIKLMDMELTHGLQKSKVDTSMMDFDF